LTVWPSSVHITASEVIGVVMTLIHQQQQSKPPLAAVVLV